MTSDWSEPRRIEAHRLLRPQASQMLPTTAVQRPALPSRTVEHVFHAGLLQDIVLGPMNEINTRIDTFFDTFRGLPLLNQPISLWTWGTFAAEANNRRLAAESFLGQSLQDARDFLATAAGRFLVRALPFENRHRRNDMHELLYFRDSGIHRRLIERTAAMDHWEESA